MLRDKTKDRLVFIVTFLLLCCSQDTLFFGTNENEQILELAKLLPFAGMFVLLFITPSFSKQNLALFVAMAIMLMAACFVHDEPYNNYLYRIAILGCAFLLIEGHSEKFWEYFTKILGFLCVWSIATFVLVIIAPQIMNVVPPVKNYLGYKYANFICSIVPFETQYSVARNHLIFREPGVAIVLLTIAIFYELKKNTDFNFKRLVLYFITLLTTMSTAGMIVMIAIIGYILFVKKNFTHRGVMFLLTGIAFIFLLNFTDLFDAENAIWTKFSSGTNNYGSWFSRLSSVTENIEIALENPIFGIGRYHLYDTTLAEDGVYVAVSNTNTLLINFAAFGISYGVLHLIGLIKYASHNEHGYLRSFLVFAIIFMALANEDMGQNIIYYALVFSGFTNATRRTENEHCVNQSGELWKYRKYK